MTRRIAVIPARGGSKRISGKNVRDFCGKPMIGHILDTARASALFDVIHVSTESEEVRQVVSGLGFEIDFLRPDDLADDHTPLIPVLKFTVDAYAKRGQEFDEVWLLMACSPFVGCAHLREAASLLVQSGGTQPVIAVARYPVPIEWAYTLGPGGLLNPVQPGKFAVRSQDIEPKYFDAGTFAGFPTAVIQSSHGAGSDSDYIGYVMDRNEVVDIDDEADWALAESMFAHRQRVGVAGD